MMKRFASFCFTLKTLTKPPAGMTWTLISDLIRNAVLFFCLL